MFVGEGYVGNFNVVYRNGFKRMVLGLGMLDREAVLRFASVAAAFVGERQSHNVANNGEGVPVRSYINKGGKRCYTIRLSSGPAERVCQALYPYLRGTHKGAQMEAAFEAAGRKVAGGR